MGRLFAGAGVIVALLAWAWQVFAEPSPPPPHRSAPASPSPAQVVVRLLIAAKAGNFTEINLYLCQRKRSNFLSGTSYYAQWEGLQRELSRTDAQPRWRISDEVVLGADASLKVRISALNPQGQRREFPDALQFGLVDEQGWKVCDVYFPGT
ncbi:hypothetical protein AB0J82_35510 [Asanoa sp. NPDC049518]|uniref:hypothetical protein n=1 Tax=unclassified Asanoa TaxID=2685164 RepID=UPI00341C598B